MKKACLYVLVSLSILAFLPAPARAQSARTTAEEFLQEVLSRKQQKGEVSVSRKRTESKTEPRQEEARTSRQGQSPSRKSEGSYKKPQGQQERQERGGYEERQGGRGQGGYENRQPERREGSRYEGRQERHERGRYGRPRDGRQDRCGNGHTPKGQGGKSKCSASHCQHPGKHKGLHKG